MRRNEGPRQLSMRAFYLHAFIDRVGRTAVTAPINTNRRIIASTSNPLADTLTCRMSIVVQPTNTIIFTIADTIVLLANIILQTKQS